MKTINTKAFSGGATMQFEVSRMGKERIRLTDEVSGTMVIIYTRNTPTIKAGHGYIVRNVRPIGQDSFNRAAGFIMNATKPALEKIPARVVSAAIKATPVE